MYMPGAEYLVVLLLTVVLLAIVVIGGFVLGLVSTLLIATVVPSIDENSDPTLFTLWAVWGVIILYTLIGPWWSKVTSLL